MRIRLTDAAQPCAVVEGEFVFGTQTCGALTKFVETQTGDDNRICLTHIEQARHAQNREAESTTSLRSTP